MDSNPIVEDTDAGQQPAAETKLQDMEFDIDDQFLKMQESEIDHDQELLQIQRRKSTPKVVVEEFVQVDSDEEPDEKKPKEEESKEGDEIMNDVVNSRPHKLKTHIEIDDFSQLQEGQDAQIGLHEFSPLERHYKNPSPGGLSGSSDPSDDKADQEKVE